MQYAAFVFGIFGMLAYVELSALKKRISELERQLTGMQGTAYHEERQGLLKAVRELTGRKVNIDLKEDYEDPDIIMYGNTKHGSNTVLDADNEWILIRIDTPKGSKTKLIRMEALERIAEVRE